MSFLSYTKMSIAYFKSLISIFWLPLLGIVLILALIYLYRFAQTSTSKIVLLFFLLGTLVVGIPCCMWFPGPQYLLSVYSMFKSPRQFRASMPSEIHVLGPKKALQEYEKALAKNPRDVNTRLQIGSCYELLGKPRDALNAYKAASFFKPDDAELHYKIGQMFLKLGETEQAIKAYEHALSLPGLFSQGYYVAMELINICYKTERYQDVINVSARYRTKNVDMLYNILAVSYNKLGQSDGARSTYENIRKICEERIQEHIGGEKEHYWLGMVQLQLGDKSAALQEYKYLSLSNPAVFGNRDEAKFYATKLLAEIEKTANITSNP